MIQVSSRSWPAYLFALVAVSLVACASGGTDSKSSLDTSPDDKSGQTSGSSTSGDDDDGLNADPNTGTGAFGSTTSSSGSTTSSSSSSSGTVVTTAYCPGTLAAGDLAITELMISSKSGSGDTGEWVEVTSTRDCVLKLDGVTVTSPRGSLTDSAAVRAGYELKARGTFLVSGSATTAGLTGDVFSWGLGDVLKNDTDTVTVKNVGTVIDSVTYSSPGNVAGTSLEFPASCAAALRANVSSDWVSSTTTFGGTFKGTPNAPNNDVACLQ